MFYISVYAGGLIKTEREQIRKQQNRMSVSNITFVTVSGNEKIASCFFLKQQQQQQMN